MQMSLQPLTHTSLSILHDAHAQLKGSEGSPGMHGPLGAGVGSLGCSDSTQLQLRAEILGSPAHTHGKPLPQPLAPLLALHRKAILCIDLKRKGRV